MPFFRTIKPNRCVDSLSDRSWENWRKPEKVPPARLERARPERAQALNLPCMPIPPRGRLP